MDITVPLIGAAMSLAAAIAGYRAGKKRRPIDHTREVNKIGALLRLPRQRGESDDQYLARLLECVHVESSND